MHFLPMLICMADYVYMCLCIYVPRVGACMYVVCARTLSLAAGWTQGVGAAAALPLLGCQIWQTLTQTNLSAGFSSGTLV